MGFNQTQWVVDALITTQELKGEWGFLLLVARHPDQYSSTFKRSQKWCGKQMDLGERQIREYQRRWRDRGIIEVVRHGGGPTKECAVLRINHQALIDYQISVCKTKAFAPPTSAGKPPEIAADASATARTPEPRSPENRVDLEQWRQDLRSSGRITGK